jgi:glycosyltransferase involved in cell wall biosynthesis
LYEGFPNTYIQSWLREVPVASLTVDPDNILVRNGIGFCSGSYNQLRNDVQKLLESPSLREKMGKKAREYALKNHDMTRNASIMKGIFDNFCSN